MTAVLPAAELDLRAILRPGDRIVAGQACGAPTTLIEARFAQGLRIAGLSLFGATSFSGLMTPAAPEAFAAVSLGAIGALRALTRVHRLRVILWHVSR